MADLPLTHAAQPVAVFIGAYFAVAGVDRVLVILVDSGAVDQKVQGQPGLVPVGGVRTVFHGGHEPRALQPGGVHGKIAAFVDGPEPGNGGVRSVQRTITVVRLEQAALAGGFGREHHVRRVDHALVHDLKGGVGQSGVTVDFHHGFLGGHGPSGHGTVAGRHLGVFKGVPVPPVFDDVFSGKIDVGTGHEDGAVF